MADKDIIAEAREQFDLCEKAESENRQRWVDDMEFSRLGKQWPDSIVKQRERESRPCLTFNRLPTFMRQVVNDSRMNRPTIKVHPAGNGADVQTADILNGLIRNIEQSSNADVAYDTAIEHAVGGGFGYFRVNVDYADDDAFDLDLRIDRVANPLSVYGDPDSSAADSSDWNVAFVTDWMSKDAFEEKYKNAETASFDADANDKSVDWFQDEMIRVAEWWQREQVAATVLQLTDGSVMYEEEYLKMKDILDVQSVTVKGSRPTKTHKVTQRIISGAEELEKNDWLGKFIPIIPVYGDEIIVEGKRYFFSLIHFAKDAQNSYNYWRTSAVEKVALDTKAPWIGPKGAFKTDSEKWATANIRNHPYIEFDGGIPPQRTAAGGVPAGDMQMALSASDDMKSIMGIYDASLGAKSNETSGKAIIARQREGDVSTFHFIDNMSRGIRHAGRIIIDMIPKVYNTPRILRTLQEDGTPGTVPVNQEILIQGIPRVFDLTAGKYDVTVSSGPGFTTRREEAANQMIELLRAFPKAAQVIGDLVAKNLDWPGADEIAKRFKALLPAQLQGDNPQVKQLQMQLQQQGALIEQGKQMIGALQQQLNDKQASIGLDAEKVKIDAFKAETDRMEAEIKLLSEQNKTQQTALQNGAQPETTQAAPIDLSPILQSIAQIQQQLTMPASSPVVVNFGGMTRKSAKAVKQMDGSWVMESVEQPIDDTGPV